MVQTVELFKPDGQSLGFKVVGLNDEKKKLGIYIQEIHDNGIAARYLTIFLYLWIIFLFGELLMKSNTLGNYLWLVLSSIFEYIQTNLFEMMIIIIIILFLFGDWLDKMYICISFICVCLETFDLIFSSFLLHLILLQIVVWFNDESHLHHHC